jgi:hypothetical protein
MECEVEGIKRDHSDAGFIVEVKVAENYGREKLYSASLTLATGLGDIKERLENVAILHAYVAPG